jgi:hypothetical protein
MVTGVSLGWSFVPTGLMGKSSIRRRVHHRDGKREIWLFYEERYPKLPVRRDGQLQFARWGNGRGQSRYLPRTGWTWLSTVESGYWSHIGGIFVDIPANFAYDRGVWVHVRQGIRGILVPDERGKAVAYMICEPASHYYQVMTRSDRMPVLIDERI